MRPAGFWRRCAAWSLDAALVALPVLALFGNHLHGASAALAAAWATLVDAVAQRMAVAFMAMDPGAMPGPGAVAGLAREWLRDPALLAAADGLQSALLSLAGAPLAAFVALHLAWCVGFERSPLQATPGKRALGLRVVGASGGRIGLATALARFLAGTLSWLSLNIGHMLSAAAPEHAALHDRISRTRVVLAPGAPGRMPAWASAWLVLQAAALLLATAWLSLAMAASLQAALERAPWG